MLVCLLFIECLEAHKITTGARHFLTNHLQGKAAVLLQIVFKSVITLMMHITNYVTCADCVFCDVILTPSFVNREEQGRVMESSWRTG